VKNILVTGAAGFIGTNLCKKLIKNGHNVIGIDNLLCPSPLNLPKEVLFFEMDVQNITHSTILEDIDEIYHLASIASPKFYKKHPFDTIDTNVNGTIAIAKFALTQNAKLLLVSSSEIYGQPEIFPQPESYFGHRNTIGDRSCYDCSKGLGETIIYEYAKKGLRATICRLHNTFGPGMRLDDGRFIVEFIQKAINNKDVIIFNNGEQTRCLTYIDDTIDGIIKAMENNSFGPFNIGSTNEMSVNEIAELIINIIGSQSKIKHIEYDKDDPKRRIPDITRAKKILNWEPKEKLINGLRKTIKNIVELMSENKKTIINIGRSKISIIDTHNFEK